MSTFSANHEDTLRTLRTGKGGDGSPLTSLRRFMAWGRNNQDDVLPYSGGKGAAEQNSTSFLTWPPWANTQSSQTPFYDTFGLSLMQRYAAFGLCIFGAALLFFLAFMHLPLVILRPSKFVIPYCLGNMFLFISFGFLHGFFSYSKHLFGKEKWPFTAAFLGTTVATLYVAMVLKMYALTIPMAIVQFLAMAAFVISYLPGGTSGLSMMGSFASSSLRSRVSGY